MRNLAEAGHVVIIGRGANVILGDTPGVLHVGMLAPMSRRVATIMEREHLDEAGARQYLEGLEDARISSSRNSLRFPLKTRPFTT